MDVIYANVLNCADFGVTTLRNTTFDGALMQWFRTAWAVAPVQRLIVVRTGYRTLVRPIPFLMPVAWTAITLLLLRMGAVFIRVHLHLATDGGVA